MAGPEVPMRLNSLSNGPHAAQEIRDGWGERPNRPTHDQDGTLRFPLPSGYAPVHVVRGGLHPNGVVLSAIPVRIVGRLYAVVRDSESEVTARRRRSSRKK
jgi:hypothetical protein